VCFGFEASWSGIPKRRSSLWVNKTWSESSLQDMPFGGVGNYEDRQNTGREILEVQVKNKPCSPSYSDQNVQQLGCTWIHCLANAGRAYWEVGMGKWIWQEVWWNCCFYIGDVPTIPYCKVFILSFLPYCSASQYKTWTWRLVEILGLWLSKLSVSLQRESEDVYWCNRQADSQVDGNAR